MKTTEESSLASFQVHGHLDAVGDFDEWDSAVHSVIFTIEGHRSCDRIVAGSFADKRKAQLLGFGDSANGKVAIHFKCVGTCLDVLSGSKVM